MATFLIGVVILLVGGFFYGKFTEKVFGPDDRKTPAERLEDGVDFVKISKWRNCLIELLNIAGTGPILGPILGILFGPVAFLIIPIGCVLAGAVHDYIIGMISLRNDGAQTPRLIQKYMGNKIYKVYNVFVTLMLLLVGTVFLYTPGDLILTQLLGVKTGGITTAVVIVYGLILLYYVIATLFPLDAIIGKIYPIFGAVLILSAIGVGIGMFVKGYQIDNVTFANVLGSHPDGVPLIPTFFVTVACGIVSGFHSSQCTLISRSMCSEREGKMSFYNMMIVEGLIAMIWAAAAMGIYNKGIDPALVGTPSVVGSVARDLLGSVGGAIAVIGVIVLPITSGDTALRSLRLILAETFNVDQVPKKNRLMFTGIIFIPVVTMLVFAKINPSGFNILWRYFSWSNQTVAVFGFALCSVYLLVQGKKYIITLIPGTFYCFVVTSYIINAKIGFNLPLYIAYIVAGIASVCFWFGVIRVGKAYLNKKTKRNLK